MLLSTNFQYNLVFSGFREMCHLQFYSDIMLNYNRFLHEKHYHRIIFKNNFVSFKK